MATDPAMTNLFVYLVGFAGTGKLTIARAFARLVGAKVVDNHWINNPIFGLIDSDGVTPLPDEVWAQVAKVREAVLETIATLAKPETNFVLTHEGVEGDPIDQAVFESIRGAVPGSSRFVCCVRKANWSAASNRPSARACSNASIRPTRSTRAAIVPCSTRSYRPL